MQKHISDNIESVYNLSPMQQGMLFHKTMNERSDEYFLQSEICLRGKVDFEKFKICLDLISQKHEALRTMFFYRECATPKQIVLKARMPEVVFMDISGCADTDEKINAIKHLDIRRGFDLEMDPLLRVTIVTVSKDVYKVIWSSHHIIMDGWCISIILGDLLRYYNALLKGADEKKLKEEIQIKAAIQPDYGTFLKLNAKRDIEEALRYWKEELEGYETAAEIPTLLSNLPETDSQVEETGIVLSVEQTEALKRLASEEQVTVNTVLETAWGIVLQQYNHTRDVVFGKVVSGRNVDIPGVEGIVGLFINTIPCRINTEVGESVESLLKKVQGNANQAGQYDYAPLAEVQSQSTMGRDLIKTLFVFENYYFEQSIAEGGMEGAEIELLKTRERTNYLVSVTASMDTQIALQIEYNPNSYSKREIDEVLAHYALVLEEIGKDPKQSADQIAMCTPDERKQILTRFNDTAAEYPRGKTVIDLFEEQVKKTPINVAVVYEGKQLTYAELNAKANQLARRLRGLGVQPDDFVAMLTERSLEMIIGIYGILKAGGAYVPMDPTYPEERIRYMLEDCKPKAILIYQAEIQTDIPVIELAGSEIWTGKDENLEHVNQSNDLAYCIYTSGTTGKPKGVMIEQQSLHNLIVGYTRRYELTEEDTVLQAANYIFDQSVWDIFNILTIGGTLCLISYEDIRNPEKVARYCKEKGVTVAALTPALITELKPEAFETLRLLESGGEAAKEEVIKKWRTEKRKVFNTYGPTENTVNTTSYLISGNEERNIPIGSPTANTNVYILQNEVMCGIGMPGELCIVGDGIARGYLNQPELTAEKFIDNPFGEGKLYRSGDLARWLPDGNLEYLGRIDEQVKIRGFRIEIKEVAKAISNVDKVRDCAVIARKDRNGEKAIYAYIVSEEEISVTEIRDTLRKMLPDYMIPAYITQIEQIPVTRNGKLDKQALPDIVGKSEREYIAPKSVEEEAVCAVFSEILGVEKVGVNDNFFDLGGNSITVISICALIKKVFSVSITASDVFNNSTPAALAEIIETAAKVSVMELYRLDDLRYFSLSPAQKNLWSMSIMRNTASAMNITTPMLVRNYDPDILKKAFGSMVKRHSVLRTRFTMVAGKPKQYLDENAGYISLIQEQDLSTDYAVAGDKNAFCEALVEQYAGQPMDLLKEPPVRAFLTKLEDGYCLFTLVIHHIILDELSTRILMNDFKAAIQAASEKTELPAPNSSSIRYADYAELQSRRLAQGEFNKEKAYWQQKLQQPLPTLKLTTDFERPLKKTMEGRAENMVLPPELSTQLNVLAKNSSNSIFVLLLMSVYLLLNKYTGQSDIIVGTVVNCRTSKELHDMVGYFLNTVPIRITASPSAKYTQLINTVKTCLFEAIENQNYPLGSIMADLADSGVVGQRPLFNVLVQLISYKNASESSTLSVAGMDFSLVRQNSTQSKYDLVFNFYDTADGIHLSLEYDTHLFKNETILRMLDRFREIVQCFITEPDGSPASAPKETVAKRANFTIKRRS